MSALDTIEAICSTKLAFADLKCCLVTDNKRPIKTDDTPARPNCKEDFVDIDVMLQCKNLSSYAGIGVSVQASNICAIDVDSCFSIPFDINSADERAKDILSRFETFGYCEFSFSGTGLRVLFKHDVIQDYSDKYYIKNEVKSIEYYQPSSSYRYVTITGKSIFNNYISDIPNYVLEEFLEDYMLKPIRRQYISKVDETETKTLEQLLIDVKKLYFKDFHFQSLWFSHAPGSNSNESELDYAILARLYENITTNKDLLKAIFETSPYFKSKDWKHMNKWTNQNFRYFNYVYEQIRRTHI